MQTVRLSDHGILPRTDVTLSLHALLKQYPCDTEFVFENDEYYFSPHEEMYADYRISNSDVTPYRVLAIWMKEMKNCILRGNGARLYLAGQMQVFTLDRCEDVTLDGFTVNWKKPLVAEGTVVAKDGLDVDVFIDPTAFPHRFRDGVLEFDVGADEWYAYGKKAIVFEPHSLLARRGVSDVFFDAVVPLGEGRFRLTLRQDEDIRAGDLLNLRHNARIHAGLFSEKCRNVTVQNVTFHSCGGLGCLAQFCRDLTYRSVHFLPDFSAGRAVSGGRDDGFHLTCNLGTVTVTECTFYALMDDPINIHGCCVTADEVVDERTLLCRYRHPQACGFHYWAERGDEIAFLSRAHMHQIGRGRVASYELLDLTTFRLTFDAPLAEEVVGAARRGDALALDNLTHTAAFVCTKNRFGSGRARSILVSTPKPVRISENYFESSGSAILICGDSNYWFESGACEDVEISHNFFADTCLGSEYEFGDGVISISPVIPKPLPEKPFHRNVRIEKNVFDTVGSPVLSAFSCADLRFVGNCVLKSPSAREAEPLPLLRFSDCVGVTVKENSFVGLSPSYSATNCIASDIDMN